MKFTREYYNSFYTFKDADLQKKLVYVHPLSTSGVIDPDSEQSVYKIQKGIVWPDLLYTGWPGSYLVSEKTREVIGEATGILFRPITILNKDSSKVELNYYAINITGKSGGLVKEYSMEERSTRIPGGPTFTKKIGLFFELDTWDNSDFFTPENTLNIFTTIKIKNAIEKHNLTNILMRPIADVETF